MAFGDKGGGAQMPASFRPGAGGGWHGGGGPRPIGPPAQGWPGGGPPRSGPMPGWSGGGGGMVGRPSPFAPPGQAPRSGPMPGLGGGGPTPGTPGPAMALNPAAIAAMQPGYKPPASLAASPMQAMVGTGPGSGQPPPTGSTMRAMPFKPVIARQ